MKSIINSNLNDKISKPKSILTSVVSGTDTGTLKQPLTDFDFINIGIGHTSDASACNVSTLMIPSKIIYDNYGKVFYSVGGNLDTRMGICFSNSTTFRIHSQSGNLCVNYVVGC